MYRDMEKLQILLKKPWKATPKTQKTIPAKLIQFVPSSSTSDRLGCAATGVEYKETPQREFSVESSVDESGRGLDSLTMPIHD